MWRIGAFRILVLGCGFLVFVRVVVGNAFVVVGFGFGWSRIYRGCIGGKEGFWE